MNRLHAAALRYAAIGWPVFPIHGIVDGRCTCGRHPCKNAGKHPHTPKGLHDASTDVATIRAWWTKWPAANVAVPAGKDSGFIAVDVDPRNGGSDSLDDLIAEHGLYPPTRQAVTGGGGRHILFRHPGWPVKNMNGGSGLAPGIDLKGDGGYIVAAPSRHASGRTYAWDGLEDSGLADPPEWLLAKIRPRANPEKTALVIGQAFSEGGRHQALVSYAGKLRRSGCNSDELLASLRVFNQTKCKPPKSEAEIRKIATDIERRYDPARGLAEPKTLAGDDCAAVLQEEIQPMEWTIRGMLPKGLYLLADREKGGKSYLAMQMALAVALGRGVFRNSDEYSAGKPGKAYYFDLEMDKATFQERLHFLDAFGLLPGHMRRFTELGRLTETGVVELVNLLDREPADLLVIDTLAAATRSAGTKHQDVFKSEYAELAGLRDLAHERGGTILVLHHTNRSIGRENVFDSISGTRARGAATDGNLVISRSKGVTVLHGVGRRLAGLEIAIKLWRGDTPGWSLLGDAEAVQRSAERDTILRLLFGGEPMTPAAIAAALGKNRNTIRWLLCQMAKDAELKRHGDGAYSAVLSPAEAGSTAL